MNKALIILLAGLIVIPAVFAYESLDKFLVSRDDARVMADLQKTIGDVPDSDGIIRAWIFFTDKGFSTAAEYENRLVAAKSQLTPRSLNRRQKARGRDNAVDYLDIPVEPSYVNQVLATGAKQRKILRWFNAMTVECDAQQLTQISHLPFVASIRPIAAALRSDDVSISTPATHPSMSTSTLNYGASEAQIEQINASVAHELRFKGQGVLVCMMDTGYRQSHRAFQQAINDGRLLAQYDFVFNDGNTDLDTTQETEDQPRHGTLTWSALGGETEGQLYGPAYGADFILAKTENISSERHIEEDNWAAAAQWADSIGADVISASLGYRYDFTPPDQSYSYEDMNGDSTIVTRAADLAVLNGITVVTAMGNDGDLGPGSLIAPADGDSVIACGAVDEYGYIAYFSALGPTYDGRIKPEICARGVGTACADPFNMQLFTNASGTSLSTPLCGGAAAVLLSIHPHWTPMMVREAMMMTANNADNPDNNYGNGIIDVGKAMYYHPEGDIVIDHRPLITFALYPTIPIAARIYGGAGINPTMCFVYSRETGGGLFTQTALTTTNNLDYSAAVPTPDTGGLEYYITAMDINGVEVTYPFGAPEHYFKVRPVASRFEDSFEDGLYYWKTSGIKGCWAITAERAATGNISVTDSPFGEYHNNDTLDLESYFPLDLTNVDSIACSVKARWELQTNYDRVVFQASSDGGSSWTNVGLAITGTNTNFTTQSFNLTPFLGYGDVRLRFRMTTNSSTTRNGIYLDDFTLYWRRAVGIDNGRQTELPVRFSLQQNYPNPFNANTEISFSIPKSGYVQIDIYDLGGRKLKTIHSGEMEAGSHSLLWDGRNESGDLVGSGIYFYRLKAESGVIVKKMTLLK
jgi:hypothetical protein